MTVLLYEYARSCPKVRAAIEQWHAKRVDFRQLQKLDFHRETTAIRAKLRRRTKATNADAVDAAFDPQFQRDGGIAASLFLTHLKLLTFESGFPNGGRTMALTFTNFDQPWSKLRSSRGDPYLKARLLPAAARSGGVMGNLGPAWTYQELLVLEPSLRHEEILIDWNVPLDEMTSSFRAWAALKRATIISRPGNPPGKRARWERLKWLAAFRIHNAGYNFNAARELMEHRRLAFPVADQGGDVVPAYASSAAWGKVVLKVRTTIEGDVMRWIGASFGFADFS